jgi:hypothetical protein
MLSHEQVVASGLEVVAEMGWSGLSLRSVAAKLGVTPMALYRYVDDGPKLQQLLPTSLMFPARTTRGAFWPTGLE